VVNGEGSYKKVALATVPDAVLDPSTATAGMPTPDEGEGGGDKATPAPTPTVTSSSRSKFPLPIILTGGLTPTKVTAAITQVGPWVVDVSGGVETEDGLVKDLDKVQAFIVGVKGNVGGFCGGDIVDQDTRCGRDEIENINTVVLSLPLFQLSFPSKIKYLWVDDATNDMLFCSNKLFL
jgi:hypothetical protein